MLAELKDRGIVIHIIGLCETHLTSESHSSAVIENYQTVHKFRSQRSGGGVSLLVHDKIKIMHIFDTPYNESFESVCAEIGYKGCSIFIGEIYRPPNTNNVIFEQSLLTMLNQCDKFKTSFLCGDFNHDLLKTHLHGPTNKFYSAMLDHNYMPLIVKPTWVTYSSGTLTDNIYVKSGKIKKSYCYVIIDGMSDHYLCLVLYSLVNHAKDNGDEVILEKRI